MCAQIAVLREEESQRLSSALGMINSLSEQAASLVAAEAEPPMEERGQPQQAEDGACEQT